jgi:mannose-6-phosphate isomerase-like protein (cupin superfamily)
MVQIFYVLSGKGTIEIGDEQREVGADTLIFSPARIPHCWYNRGSEAVKIMMAKTPRPAAATRLP